MAFVERLRQRGWIPFAALALALLLARVPALVQLERLLGDAQRGLAAKQIFFSDAVFVDIDESSLRRMKPYLGDWPYGRDIYALVFDYLNEHGAAAVVFDILLTDQRAGDEAFARSLRARSNGVLVAATPTDGRAMTPAERKQLAGLGWRAPAGLASVSWPSFLLPNATLLEGAPATAVGVVAAVADADGVLRRMPLLHQVGGVALPSLPVAAIDPGDKPRKLVRDSERWRIGAVGWPVDADGFVHLYFPANANAVLTMSFQEVAEAALGLSRLEDASDFFGGKTIFIGSTAHLSDRVDTPNGSMSGTYALAIAHQTLLNGLAWRPPTAAWNALLAGLAVAALFGLLHPLARSWGAGLLWVAASGTAIGALHLGLLYFAMQQAALLPPLMILILGWVIHAAYEQSRLRQRASRLEMEADLDSLTGLPVRRAFMRVLRQETAEARRQVRPLAIAILDIDHFKQVNDTYGHPMGDLVIKTFAEVLRRRLRASDAMGRWGGEEFVVLLPNTDLAGAIIVLEKVRQAIGEERFPVPADALKVTVSAGVAQYDSADMSPEDVLSVADRALYEAKRSGRNRVCASH